MIKIDKGPAPNFLVDPNKKWQKEIQLALQYYGSGQTVIKPFKFKHYRDGKLKEELKKVFKKCAYCESRYASTQDGDVEHFRPKLRVQGKQPESPGYYWLANDWDNLLLSCQHCNQGRIQRLVELGIPIKTAKQGKLDQFPLKQGGQHISHNGGLVSEEPFRLLIHPCIDDPALHFDYDMTHAVMIAKTEMAATSLDVYALKRISLIEERKLLLDFFLTQLDLFHRSVMDYDANPTDDNRTKMQMNLEQINRLTAKDAQYSGMTNFFFLDFKRKNGL